MDALSFLCSVASGSEAGRLKCLENGALEVLACVLKVGCFIHASAVPCGPGGNETMIWIDIFHQRVLHALFGNVFQHCLLLASHYVASNVQMFAVYAWYLSRVPCVFVMFQGVDVLVRDGREVTSLGQCSSSL